MRASAALDPTLLAALGSAVEACRHALADYRAGLIDEDELRAEVLGVEGLPQLRAAIDELARGAA
jgi:hypothetical protein